MTTWGLIVIISLALALLSMVLLMALHKRLKEPYSHCFWKGFFVAFVLVTLIFTALRLTGVITQPLLFGLPIALGTGSLTGLLLEFLRNRFRDQDFWTKC
jgi:hypothetical protein